MMLPYKQAAEWGERTVSIEPTGRERKQAVLPDEYWERIDRIRTAVASRNGLTEHGDWIIFILESWLLDEEQLTVLGGNPLNGFYLQAAAYLNPETNIRGDWTTLGIPDLWQARLIAEIIDLSNLPPDKWGSPRRVEDKDQLAAVPVELLAAALSLAERLDLHHPDTLYPLRKCFWIEPL